MTRVSAYGVYTLQALWCVYRPYTHDIQLSDTPGHPHRGLGAGEAAGMDGGWAWRGNELAGETHLFLALTHRYTPEGPFRLGIALRLPQRLVRLR